MIRGLISPSVFIYQQTDGKFICGDERNPDTSMVFDDKKDAMAYFAKLEDEAPY